MKAIVAIPAYDRPDIFAKCLESFSKNDRSLFDIIISPDCSSREGEAEIDEVIKSSPIPTIVMPRPSSRLNGDANTVRVMNTAEGMGYSHIIAIGSDIIVSDNFVHDLLVLSEAFDAYSVSPTTGRQSKEEKLSNVNSIFKGSATGQNFCIPIHHWRTISPLVNAFSERFYCPEYSAEKTRDRSIFLRVILEAALKIKTPFTERMIAHMLAGEVAGGGEINTAEDGLIVATMALYGIPMVSYVINRACHPSDKGVNTTRAYYEEHYEGVVVDDLPRADPSKFVFC